MVSAIFNFQNDLKQKTVDKKDDFFWYCIIEFDVVVIAETWMEGDANQPTE